MDVVEVLAELGGVATRAQLVGVVGRPEVDAAVAAGRVSVLRRGRYGLASADAAAAAAHAASAVLSHRNAAVRHGWPVKDVPDHPDVTVPRNRRLSPHDARRLTIHRGVLGPDDVVRDGGVLVTSADRTLADCLRSLPFDEALAVADSAARLGVGHGPLGRIAAGLRGPGARQARRISVVATPAAANPFESVLRAIALDVPGLHVEPQVELWAGGTFLGRPDLVDRELALVLEADSFAWHGGRSALTHDCRRYDEMVVAGWLVLRFAYEHVMHDAVWVADVLRRAVARRTKPSGAAA